MTSMITSGELIRSHCRYLASSGRRPRTIESRRTFLHRIERVTGTPLADLSRDQVEDYIDSLVARVLGVA